MTNEQYVDAIKILKASTEFSFPLFAIDSYLNKYKFYENLNSIIANSFGFSKDILDEQGIYKWNCSTCEETLLQSLIYCDYFEDITSAIYIKLGQLYGEQIITSKELPKLKNILFEKVKDGSFLQDDFGVIFIDDMELFSEHSDIAINEQQAKIEQYVSVFEDLWNDIELINDAKLNVADKLKKLSITGQDVMSCAMDNLVLFNSESTFVADLKTFIKILYLFYDDTMSEQMYTYRVPLKIIEGLQNTQCEEGKLLLSLLTNPLCVGNIEYIEATDCYGNPPLFELTNFCSDDNYMNYVYLSSIEFDELLFYSIPTLALQAAKFLLNEVSAIECA